jgi:V8-like Glu-specific endopeptidase
MYRTYAQNELEYEDPFIWGEQRPDYAVIGPTDDRFEIPARARRPSSLLFPMNTICYLEAVAPSGSTWSGSGTLIAPQVVLSAKHVLMDVQPPVGQRARSFDPSLTVTSLRVTPGADLQSPASKPRLQRPALPGAQTTTAARIRVHPDLDFGVAILPAAFRRPAQFMMLQNRGDLNTATLLTIAGYPCDKPEGRQWGHSRRIELRNVAADHLEYTIDTCPGHSGSPIWLLGGNNVRLLLGVHTGGTSGPAGASSCANDPITRSCNATGAPVTAIAGSNNGVRVTCEVIDTIERWCREFKVRGPVVDRVQYRRVCPARR